MKKGRLEAFSDGVIAIIITIMVLELKAPKSGNWESIRAVLPVFLAYVLSYINLGIYWNNHHHMMQAVHRVSGSVLWANMHLLFWLSLVPFVTAWMGETHFSGTPVALYGVVMVMSAIAYTILTYALLACHEKDSLLARALGSDLKGKLSLVSYAVAVLVALWAPLVSCAIYVGVAIAWLAPDRRFERVLAQERRSG